jgi:Rrf2 family transcriptional regulator, nitric oxide-sensitive transcriptional repressor
MFSQTVEYALRAVIYLADHSPTGRTTQQIAEVTKVPQAYLSKVLQSLSKNGVVRSQRGIGGGISLLKSPEELTILEVVNAVDPIKRIHTCPLKINSHGTDLCPLHRRLDDSIATMEKAFSSSTLAEILADPSSSVPLCPGENSDDTNTGLNITNKP